MKIILHLEVMRYIKSYQDIYKITQNLYICTEYDCPNKVLLNSLLFLQWLIIYICSGVHHATLISLEVHLVGRGSYLDIDDVPITGSCIHF